MKITNLRVNHFDTFMGMRIEPMQLSWLVAESTGKTLVRSRVILLLTTGQANRHQAEQK